MSSDRTVVVVAFAEALAAPEVVWSLVDAGFVVIAVTRRRTPSALAHSRLVTLREMPAPETDVAAARCALADLLGEIRRDETYRRHVLLPLDDTAVWMCSEIAHCLGWTLAGPGTPAAVSLALDKRCQVEAARAAGLDTPPTVVAETVDDLQTLPFDFPIVVRPAKAVQVAGQRLGKGRNWICSNASELQAAGRAWGGLSPMLVQPYLDGVGEGVFGLMTEQGVLGWSAHRRLRMMNPHGSGSSACVSRQVDEALKGPITDFLESVGWRGMFMVELLRGGGLDARPFFVEFNGRAWGSMALARRQGLEYPAWTVHQALGESVSAVDLPPAREGLVCRNLGREFMHLVFVLRGRRSRTVHRWPTIGSALWDVLSPNPSGSFYNWRKDDWRVFASDCCYTILRNVFKPQRS